METMEFKRLLVFALVVAFLVPAPVLQAGKPDDAKLVVIELVEQEGKGPELVYAIPPTDDSMTNPDFVLLGFHWSGTANYWINPSNRYGLSASGVVAAIGTSADTWDKETEFVVFSYQGTTRKTAGKYDGYNVVAWGSYRSNVIAVTYIWYIGNQIVETDTRMNTMFKWSITGDANKMDVQNIMTHELGHWCGLADLYSDADYWLTMYGYSTNGETYKRTLGRGDINGLIAVYGP